MVVDDESSLVRLEPTSRSCERRLLLVVEIAPAMLKKSRISRSKIWKRRFAINTPFFADAIEFEFVVDLPNRNTGLLRERVR